jgi:hypothetical protein
MKKKLSAVFICHLCLAQGVCSANTTTEEEINIQKTSALTNVTQESIPWGPVSATSGSAGMGFPEGKLSASLNYRFIEADGMYLHDDKINDAVEVTKNIGIMKLRYGIVPGLDIRTCTPFYNVSVEKMSLGTEITKDGIGDSMAVLHKVIMNQRKGDALNVALDLGAVLPTATVDSNTLDFTGNQAWGVFTGVGFTYTKVFHRIDQEFNYAAFSEGEHDYQKPMRFRCNTTYAYALNSMFDMGVESSFEWNDESKEYGEEMGDSYNEWFAGPKIAMKFKKYGVFTGLGVMFPVSYDYDASSTSDSYRLEFKICKVF